MFLLMIKIFIFFLRLLVQLPNSQVGSVLLNSWLLFEDFDTCSDMHINLILSTLINNFSFFFCKYELIQTTNSCLAIFIEFYKACIY